MVVAEVEGVEGVVEEEVEEVVGEAVEAADVETILNEHRTEQRM